MPKGTTETTNQYHPLHYRRASTKECKKNVMYGSFVCTVKLEMPKPNRTRFIVGGDKINYPEEATKCTAHMLVANILFKSVISSHKARFRTLDIFNFYLMTPCKWPEYIWVKLFTNVTHTNHPPQRHVIHQINKSHVQASTSSIVGQWSPGKAPQATWIFPRHAGTRSMETQDSTHTVHTNCGWFWFKYVSKKHADHLKCMFEEHYKVTADWTGTCYAGIHLHWNYSNRQIHLYLLGYIQLALLQFQHTKCRKQNQPFPHTPIQYEAKNQFAKEASQVPCA